MTTSATAAPHLNQPSAGASPSAPATIRSLWPYFAAALLVILFYSPLMMPGHKLVLGDYYDYHIPNRVVAAQRLRTAELPQWTEHFFGGYPFLSDPQAAVFYPGNLLLAFMALDPTGPLMDWYIIAHVVLLALGSVFLARSLGIGRLGALAASVVMTFNGFIVFHLSHFNMIQTLAVGYWGLGLTSIAMQRRSVAHAVAAGLAYAVMILVGHAQIAMYVFYCAGLGGLLMVAREGRFSRPLLWKGLILLSLIFIIALLGAAIQIQPTQELLSNSGTRREVSLQEALLTVFPFRGFAGLWFPGLYQPLTWRLPPEMQFRITAHHWGFSGAWECLFYGGFIPFVVGLFGLTANRRSMLVRALFLAAILTWVLAMGRRGMLYPIAYECLPGFKRVRIPTRLMCITFTAWGLLVGIAADTLLLRAREARVRTALKATVAAVAVLVAGTLTLFAAVRLLSPDWTETFRRLFVYNVDIVFGVDRPKSEFTTDIIHQLSLAAIIVLFCMGWLLALLRWPQRSRALMGIAVLAIAAELFTYGLGKNIATENIRLDDVRTTAFAALPSSAPGRVVVMNRELWVATNAVAHTGACYAGGYNPIDLRWVKPVTPSEAFLGSFGSWREEKKLNEWNVTHLLFREHDFYTRIGERNATLPDLGYVELGASPQAGRQELVFMVPQPQGLKAVYLIATGVYSMDRPDGYQLGTVTLHNDRGPVTSAPVRMGYEVAEWSYGNPALPSPAHRKADIAFTNPLRPELYPQGVFYKMRIAAPADTVTSICVQAVAPAPASMCVSHVALEYDDHIDVRPVISALGHYVVASRRPGWTVVERTGALGEAWMVPLASAISHADKVTSVVEEYPKASFDPASSVMINDEQLSASGVAAHNALLPGAFGGHSRFYRVSPERLKISTDSNEASWLVISQSWYPGWTATVDGEASPLYQANGAHMALPIVGGTHKVVLTFSTPKLANAACVSALTWLGCIGFLGLKWRRRRQENLMRGSR